MEMRAHAVTLRYSSAVKSFQALITPTHGEFTHSVEEGDIVEDKGINKSCRPQDLTLAGKFYLKEPIKRFIIDNNVKGTLKVMCTLLIICSICESSIPHTSQKHAFNNNCSCCYRRQMSSAINH